MAKIGVGLIGYGLGGRAFHAPYVAATPGLALRAIVSRDAEKVRRDWPAVEVVPSVEELLTVDGIDLVIVSSPDAFHADHAIVSLAANKHVVVDKPFATTLADAREVMAAGDASGRLLTVFHNRRWDADFLTLRRLLAEGRLGRVGQMDSHFDRWRPVPAQVWKEAREGGSWLDLGPHLVDQALQLFGMPEAVQADLATLRDGAMAPDYFHVVLTYPACRVLLHSSKLVAANSLRFAVHGTGGSWVKHGIDRQEGAAVAGQVPTGSDWGIDPIQGIFQSHEPSAPPEPLPNERGDYGLFWRALAAAIRGEGANPVSAIEAISVMKVLDAGMRSAAERREIGLGS